MKLKVVYVSNNNSLRKLFSKICLKKSCQCKFFGSKLETVLQLLDTEIDYLILDVEKEYMLSYCLFMVLKKLRPSVKVIGLFNDVPFECIQSFRQSGLFYFLTQPVNSTELLKVLNMK